MGWFTRRSEQTSDGRVHAPSVQIPDDGTNVPFDQRLSRRNILAGLLLHKMMVAEVGQTYGAPVDPVPGDEARSVVQHVLRQDMALVGHVTREIGNFVVALVGAAPSASGQRKRLDQFVDAIGRAPLHDDGSVNPGSIEAEFGEVMILLTDFRPGVRPQGGIPAPLDRLYSTQGRAECVDLLSYGALCVARCINAGHFQFVVDDKYKAVTELRQAGWYPSPTDVSTSSGKVERYWDGEWTDQVRRWVGRRWQEVTIPLSEIW